MLPLNPATHMAAWLESAWLARYLDRQLSADERAWFEAYVLDKPGLLEAIEIDTTMRDALALERSSLDVHLATAAAAQPAADTRRRSSPFWSAAAALALGLAVGGFAVRYASTAATQAPVVANPPRIVFDTMRGEALPAHVDHASSDSPYVFVEVAVPYGASEIVLESAGAEPVPMQPSADGFVSALVRRDIVSSDEALAVRYRANGAVISKPLTLSRSGVLK